MTGPLEIPKLGTCGLLKNATFTTAMFSGTMLDAPAVIPEQKNRAGLVAFGAISAVGMGLLWMAGRDNDDRQMRKQVIGMGNADAGRER